MSDALAPDTRREPPWDDLDPGIVGVVRALWEMGFEPFDSGDGRHKSTLPGYGEEGPYGYSPIPHVVLSPRDLRADMEALFLWCEAQGFEDVEVQAGIFRNPHSEPPHEVEYFIILGGDGLHGWEAR